ncbi:MAG: isochorismatase family protein [Lachnospiraceae bacterium]|nr:isochorismatase family protein [Lachnospiraceae bacterium]
MVLLVVDTQEQITNSGLYHFYEFENAVKTLLDTARETKVEVIYVRHDDGPGKELTKGTPGFEIYEGFIPKQGERM